MTWLQQCGNKLTVFSFELVHFFKLKSNSITFLISQTQYQNKPKQQSMPAIRMTKCSHLHSALLPNSSSFFMCKSGHLDWFLVSIPTRPHRIQIQNPPLQIKVQRVQTRSSFLFGRSKILGYRVIGFFAHTQAPTYHQSRIVDCAGALAVCCNHCNFRSGWTPALENHRPIESLHFFAPSTRFFDCCDSLVARVALFIKSNDFLVSLLCPKCENVKTIFRFLWIHFRVSIHRLHCRHVCACSHLSHTVFLPIKLPSSPLTL